MAAAVPVGQPRNSFCCSVWLCVSHHVFLLFISCLRFVCNLYLNYTVIITATPSLLSAEPFFATMHMWNSCIYRNRVIGWSWDRNWQSQRRMLSWLLRRSRGDVLQWINIAHYRDVNCGQLSSLMRRWFYITRVEMPVGKTVLASFLPFLPTVSVSALLSLLMSVANETQI